MHHSFRANLPPLKTDPSHITINPMNHNTTTATTMATTTNNSTEGHLSSDNFDHKAMGQLVPLPSSLPSPSTPAAGVVHADFDVVNSAPTPIFSTVNSSDNSDNNRSNSIVKVHPPPASSTAPTPPSQLSPANNSQVNTTTTTNTDTNKNNGNNDKPTYVPSKSIYLIDSKVKCYKNFISGMVQHIWPPIPSAPSQQPLFHQKQQQLPQTHKQQTQTPQIQTQIQQSPIVLFPVRTWRTESELETMAHRFTPTERLLSLSSSHPTLDTSLRLLVVTHWFLSQYLSAIPNNDSWLYSHPIRPLLGETFHRSWHHPAGRYIGRSCTTEFCSEQVTRDCLAVHWSNEQYGMSFRATVRNESESYRFTVPGAIDVQQTIIDDNNDDIDTDQPTSSSSSIFPFRKNNVTSTSRSSSRLSLPIVSSLLSFASPRSPHQSLNEDDETSHGGSCRARSSIDTSSKCWKLFGHQTSGSGGGSSSSSIVLHMKQFGESYRVHLPVIRHKFNMSLWPQQQQQQQQKTPQESVRLMKQLKVVCRETGMVSTVNFLPTAAQSSTTASQSTASQQFEGKIEQHVSIRGERHEEEENDETSDDGQDTVHDHQPVQLVAKLSGDLATRMTVVAATSHSKDRREGRMRSQLPFVEQEFDMHEETADSEEEAQQFKVDVADKSPAMETESHRIWHRLFDRMKRSAQFEAHSSALEPSLELVTPAEELDILQVFEETRSEHEKRMLEQRGAHVPVHFEVDHWTVKEHVPIFKFRDRTLRQQVKMSEETNRMCITPSSAV